LVNPGRGERLAYANLLVKMHKDTISWRCLASCSN
jgi:hypothetical protein